MIEHWNKRYSDEEYAYGEQPNRWFQQQLDLLSAPGKILMPAEGEGRNAVYAAKLGWTVSAFDPSSAGRDKAIKLAKRNMVNIDYRCGQLEDMNYLPESFDAAGLIFAHLPQDQQLFHRQIGHLIGSGGYLILEGFSRANLAYRQRNPKIGGPPDIDMLFSEEMIAAHFRDFEPIYLAEEEVTLQEGIYHQGQGMVIRFLGKKKA